MMMMMMIMIMIIIIRRRSRRRNRGTIGQKILARTCAKISRKKSRRQGNHIVESTSTN